MAGLGEIEAFINLKDNVKAGNGKARIVKCAATVGETTERAGKQAAYSVCFEAMQTK